MSNFSNNDPKQDGLKGTFEDIRAGSENGDELIFDPATGELRSSRSAEDPDRVPATQMAREGFFLQEGNAPIGQPQSIGELGSPAPAPTAEGEELVFNSATGKLQAAPSAEARDRVPATRMAREGFFAEVYCEIG